jgi:uncharacterized membrane protein
MENGPMLPWAFFLGFFAMAALTLSAMGAGSQSLGRLLLAFFLMATVSVLIAWPFLRKRSPRR